MRIGSLFAGIGGLELGLERAGLGRVVWQVERDPFCRDVLARHWLDVSRAVEDVHHASRATLTPVDVICGGFPCQPASVAGKRLAQRDPRWLWPEFARVIGELCPAIVVAENVRGLRSAGLRDVLADLAALGFDAEWCVGSAGEIGAPHERPRIWIVATHPDRVRVREQPGWLGRAWDRTRAPLPGDDAASRDAADADSVRRLEQARRIAYERGWDRLTGWVEPDLARVDDGVPCQVGQARKAYGNAVVPACAEVVGRAIVQACEVTTVSRLS